MLDQSMWDQNMLAKHDVCETWICIFMNDFILLVHQLLFEYKCGESVSFLESITLPFCPMSEVPPLCPSLSPWFATLALHSLCDWMNNAEALRVLVWIPVHVLAICSTRLYRTLPGYRRIFQAIPWVCMMLYQAILDYTRPHKVITSSTRLY